jgi:hypothetical protein
VYFAMLSSAGTTVQCTITLGSLDALVEGKCETTPEQQAVIFDAWRPLIELTASEKFDRSDIERGMVVIRPEDFRKE